MAQVLNQLVGHREVLQSLFRAHQLDRLASTLLFAGPSGIGKKRAALALAQFLICEKGQDIACGECGSCLRVEKNQSESMLVIEPDGAQIKIEQARDVIKWLSLQRMGRARVVVIDQAHLMNPQTANSLLKSLEEPPQGTYFLLITPLAAAVLPTIRSRSQLVRFAPLSMLELQKVLGEDADEWVLRAAQGSVESAQRLLEDREAFQEIESAAYSYLAVAAERFPAAEIQSLKDLMKDKSAQAFVSSLIQSVIRDALLIRGGQEAKGAAKWREIAERIAKMPDSAFESIAQQSLGMERDMAGNVDRGLILENFAIQSRY